MTEAGWTRGKDVKVPGWYWWKYKGMLSVVELRVWPNGNKLYAKGGVAVPINALELDGEFLGPLSPTDRQQGRIEGLREATAIICEFCADSDYWAPMSNSGYHCGVNGSKLRKCKAERICERIAEIDAQAAQDEKEVGDGKSM